MTPVMASATASSGTPPVHAPNAALLIDFDNVTMGIRSDLQEELKNLLSSDIIKGKVAVRRAYADWRRYPQYIVPLTESSIDLIFAPAYGSAKKNATDIRLAIDALELVFTRPEIGTFVLLSGDSDFSSMVIKLKEYGKYVIGVGIRESSSDLLVMNCDEYYSYNALAGLVKTGDDESTRWDPWQLVTEAIGRMKRNGDVMRSDRLKQVMQEIDASFDEKNLGMPKFSRFVQDAVHRGLLKATKLESGQLEVDLPDGTRTVAAPAATVASAESPTDSADETDDVVAGEAPVDGAPRREEREDREGRRGRRGRRGRGRGRDRGERGERVEGDAGTDAAADSAVGSDSTSTDDVVASADTPVVSTPVVSTPIVSAPVATPSATPTTEAVVPGFGNPVAAEVGTNGERLTRHEAFDLVRRSVESLVVADEVTSASAARQRAFELLGRNSESLSARNFERILQDAHDANMIDLRRRGNDFEVARAAEAASIVEQLKEVEAVQKAAAIAAAGPQAPAPRGMGARGVAPRGMAGRKGPMGPPPELLMVGIVGTSASAQPVSAPAAVAVAVAAPVPAVVAAPVAPVAAPVAAPAVVAAPVPPAAEDAPAAKAAPKAPAKGSPKGGAKAAPKTATKAPAKPAA
ncbi:MAG: NYN domain-containing protein, partial [Gemmatimonadaceae bacterium]